MPLSQGLREGAGETNWSRSENVSNAGLYRICNPMNAHSPNASRNASFQAASRMSGNEDHRREWGSRGRYCTRYRHDTTRYDRTEKRVHTVKTPKMKAKTTTTPPRCSSQSRSSLDTDVGFRQPDEVTRKENVGGGGTLYDVCTEGIYEVCTEVLQYVAG